MTDRRGWVGTMREMKWYLHVVNADRDEEGKYLVSGNIASFMGMEGENVEVVVGPDACYYVGGHRAGLAAALGSTSYGCRPIVI